MGDHKTNPQSVLHSMIPAMLPPGHAVGIKLAIEVLPKPNVLLYPADNMRRALDGKVEIQPVNSDQWEEAPAGVHVHPIGEPLPPELCDIVMLAGTAVQDSRPGGIVSADGKAATHRTSFVMHAEVSRAPLVEWQKAHLAQLRGGEK